MSDASDVAPTTPTWPAILDVAPESEGIDLAEVRQYRLGQVREQMDVYGVDALILSDSVNIRYATGTRNMQVFTSRNSPARYLLLTPDRSILDEFIGCEHWPTGSTPSTRCASPRLRVSSRRATTSEVVSGHGAHRWRGDSSPSRVVRIRP